MGFLAFGKKIDILALLIPNDLLFIVKKKTQSCKNLKKLLFFSFWEHYTHWKNIWN